MFNNALLESLLRRWRVRVFHAAIYEPSHRARQAVPGKRQADFCRCVKQYRICSRRLHTYNTLHIQGPANGGARVTRCGGTRLRSLFWRRSNPRKLVASHRLRPHCCLHLPHRGAGVDHKGPSRRLWAPSLARTWALVGQPMSGRTRVESSSFTTESPAKINRSHAFYINPQSAPGSRLFLHHLTPALNSQTCAEYLPATGAPRPFPIVLLSPIAPRHGH